MNCPSGGIEVGASRFSQIFSNTLNCVGFPYISAETDISATLMLGVFPSRITSGACTWLMQVYAKSKSRTGGQADFPFPENTDSNWSHRCRKNGHFG